MIDQETRQLAEKILGYQFRNTDLLDEALTHASVADSRLASNERLEFLGDAVLGLVVCDALFESYPDLLEGDLTKIKSAVVSRRTCAEKAREIDLPSLLVIGKGMANREALPSSLAAAVFEAVIAAIYLDGGLKAAQTFILRTLADTIEEAAESGHQQNFKSILQQYAQREFGHSASYILLDENGPDHAKCFEVCVEIGERRFTPTWAPSKKEAEQAAALNALIELGVVEVNGEEREVSLVDARSASGVGEPEE